MFNGTGKSRGKKLRKKNQFDLTKRFCSGLDARLENRGGAPGPHMLRASLIRGFKNWQNNMYYNSVNLFFKRKNQIINIYLLIERATTFFFARAPTPLHSALILLNENYLWLNKTNSFVESTKNLVKRIISKYFGWFNSIFIGLTKYFIWVCSWKRIQSAKNIKINSILTSFRKKCDWGELFCWMYTNI